MYFGLLPPVQSQKPQDVDCLDVFVDGSAIGLRNSDGSIGGSPKTVRIQGRLNADDEYFVALPSDIVQEDSSLLNTLSNQAQFLEMTIFDSSMNLYRILQDFPTNFPFVSVSFLRNSCDSSEDLQSRPLYHYIGRLVASRKLKYFNLIGDDTNTFFDRLLVELLQQDQVKEVFVHLSHALKNEVIFLGRLLDIWKNRDPWGARIFSMSFFSPFEQLDFVKSLPKRLACFDLKGDKKLYFYMAHPKSPEREVHIFRNTEGMLTLEFN
ncbi:hypothetical protein QR680_004600 [Steinernema hermaphroditum]|uniref:Uncharacterized protein n=1 Tax=Steinernema hermaphroditum TaxID=289476 RepID=A0AA39HQC9_9BILA|nr:hypothetical protein QR680_004600 [Steinernema hermaphroditum]